MPLSQGGEIFNRLLHSFGSLAWQLGTRELFFYPPTLYSLVPILASMLARVLLLFFVSIFLALNHIFTVIINLITDCIIYVCGNY